MRKRIIRKSITPSATQERGWKTHLAFKNEQRILRGDKQISFNAFACEAIQEKIDRETAMVPR